MSDEPEDAIPPGFEPGPRSESAEVARTAGKKGDYVFLTILGVPWLAAGAWLEVASRASGWVSLLMAGGAIFGLCGFLGEDLSPLPILVGGLLGLGAFAYGVVTSHDSVGMLICLGLWLAGAFMILGSTLTISEPPGSGNAGSAAAAPDSEAPHPPEPRDRDVRDA